MASVSTFENLRERTITLKANIARLEAGIDPDLPDDLELRKQLLFASREALRLCEKIIAEMLAKGLATVNSEDLA